MLPTIRTLPEKKLVGMRMRMSLTDNRTSELWSAFMPRRHEIKNSVGTDKYSVRVYDSLLYFKQFNPAAPFDKWATVEVTDFDGGSLPEGMETLTIPGGLYAVFIHKGPANVAAPTFNYIFGTWVPNNPEYALDNRPHFEILGDKYKNDEPDSEEEVWVPIRVKA